MTAVAETFYELLDLAGTDWQADAACGNAAPAIVNGCAQAEDWHADDQADLYVQRVRALSVCASCPVREQCAEYGQDIEYGIWGGQTPAMRQGQGNPNEDMDKRKVATYWAMQRFANRKLVSLVFGLHVNAVKRIEDQVNRLPAELRPVSNLDEYLHLFEARGAA